MNTNNTIKLPAGVVGVHKLGEASPNIPDTEAFFALCRSAVQTAGGIVVREDAAETARNFDATTINLQGKDITIVGNDNGGAHLLALVDGVIDPGVNSGDLPFIADDVLAKALATSGWRLLSLEALHTPIAHIDLSELAKVEHEQIAYWQPKTAGELLFNHWD